MRAPTCTRARAGNRLAAEMAETSEDGISTMICCYATQQLVHQGPPSQSQQRGGAMGWAVATGEVWVGDGRRGRGWGRGVCQGSFVAIVSVNVEAAELHRKQTIN